MTSPTHTVFTSANEAVVKIVDIDVFSVAMVHHISFNKYTVGVEQVKRSGTKVVRALHTVHNSSTRQVDNAACIRVYSRIRYKKPKQQQRRYIPRSYSFEEELVFAKLAQTLPTKVTPQNGLEHDVFGDEDKPFNDEIRPYVRMLVDSYVPNLQAEVFNFIAQCNTGEKLSYIDEAVGYVMQDIMVQTNNGVNTEGRIFRMQHFMEFAGPLVQQRAQTIATSRDLAIVLQSGCEMKDGELHDPSEAIEQRIHTALYTYRPRTTQMYNMGVLISSLNTVALIRTYADTLAHVIQLAENARHCLPAGQTLLEDYLALASYVRPLLLVQEALVLRALAQGVDLQSGDEGSVPAQLEPLVYWDDVEDKAIRSPQSGESAFSYASDSSESTIEKMRENLVDLFSNMKEACSVIVGDSPSDKRILGKVESVLWFMFYDWPRCGSYTELALVVARLVSSLVGIDNVAKAGSWLLDLLKRDVEPQMGAEGTFDMAWLIDSAGKFMTSELYGRSVKFACAAIALAVSAGTGAAMSSAKFENMWDVAKFSIKSSDIITRVLDFLRWIILKGYDLMTGKITVHELFTKPSEMQMFDTRVAHLDHMRRELEAGREQEFTFLSYALEIETLSKFAAKLARVANKQVRLTLANQIRKIEDHWSWYKTHEATMPLRRAPYAIALVGGSGVAKSCLAPYIIRMLQEAMGLSVGPEYVHNLDISEKYMTGMSNQINAMIFDDAGNTIPMYAEKQASTAIIDIVNNNKRVAVMADIDSKGQYLIKPDIVVATTNEGEFHAKSTSVSPISILRRFKIYIDVSIKPEFAVGGMIGDTIDPEEHRMDIWNLDVYYYRIEEGTVNKPQREYVFTKASFPKVMKYLVSEAKIYKARQQRLVDTCMSLKDVPLCVCGILRHMCLDCHPFDPRTAVSEQFGIERLWKGSSEAVKAPLTTMQKCCDTAKNKSIRAIRLMCVLQIMRVKARVNSLYYMVYFSAGQAASFFFIALMTPVFSMSLGLVTFFNITFWFLCVMYKSFMLWNEPLRDNMCEALASIAPARNKKNAIRFVGLLAAVAAMHAMYKAWRKANIQPQGGVLSDIAGVSNAKNIYTEQLVRPMPINFDVKTASCDQIIQSLKRRMYVGRFLPTSDPLGFAKTCTIVPICSETVIVPWHIVRDGTMKFLQVYRGSSHINNAAKMISIEGQWKRIGKSDLCILVSPVFGDQKDIRCWFPAGSAESEDRERICVNSAGCQTVWMKGSRTKDEKGDFLLNVTHGTGRVNASSSMVMDMEQEFGVTYWGGKYVSCIPTWSGMCGAPLVTDRTSGPFIIGLHSAGASGSTNARFCTVGRADIDQTLADMNDHIIPHSLMHEEGDFEQSLAFPGTPFVYTKSQGPKATSPYVRGQYDILGHNRSPLRTLRSNVKVTLWSAKLDVMGYPRQHEAPQIMNTYVPWNVWLTNVSKPSLIESPYLKMGRDDYLLHVLNELDMHPEWDFETKIRPLEHFAIISGIDGRLGVDAVNKNTSMGIPYCKAKKDFMFPVDKMPGIQCPYDIKDHIKKEIADMEMKLKAGQRVYVAHRCNLKDEAVKIGKLKVRVFMGSPFAYLYLMRKYFLPLSAFMQEYPLSFETAVGIKCYSKQWTQLYHHLTKYGSERMVAGDYKAYDQLMEIALTKASFEILLTLCKRAGYDEEQMAICRGLMTETIAGCYDLQGEWIGLCSTNPSGHALTVIINSIANSIQVRSAFYKLAHGVDYNLDFLRFADLVTLVTYGDDNAMGVCDGIPWFNHTSISRVMSEWGITYTMADKEAESVPYIDMSQVSFLKRTWQWCSVRNFYLGPLETSSIMKTLHTYVASTAIDVKEQHAQLILSANREYFLHGYEEFEKMRLILLGLAEEYKVQHFFPNCALPDAADLDAWLLE